MVDVKAIINHEMISSEEKFEKSIVAYDSISFNGAVHLTKMAETKVSRQNGCQPLSNDLASIYTERLFKFWVQKSHPVKVFDTCVKRLNNYNLGTQKEYPQTVKVFFKDCHLEKIIPLGRTFAHECANCTFKASCYSAVEQYKVLEWRASNWYENLE